MPHRHNELEAMIRQEPFAYRAAYDASNNVEYEGWSYPGTATSEAQWIICKHTYTSNKHTATQWVGQAKFDQIWDDRASLVFA